MKSELDIIKKYCGDIEKRLRACHDRSIAEALKKNLCRELNFNCKSEVIRTVLSRHVDELMNKIFDRQGRNVYLENRNDEE